MVTKEDLISFENEIKDLYLEKKIRAPIHLSDSNEQQLIDIFKMVDREDWVFSSWRSHYHALLHGIDREWLKQACLEGKSITIHKPDQRFFASAIVGGIAPIAMGTALALKRKGENRHVWCFIGDMTAECGIVYESMKYAENFDLPITFVVEDNGFSVGTPTDDVWGRTTIDQSEAPHIRRTKLLNTKVISYTYHKQYPHVGAGVYVTF